jgi:hypothetical protein
VKFGIAASSGIGQRSGKPGLPSCRIALPHLQSQGFAGPKSRPVPPRRGWTLSARDCGARFPGGGWPRPESLLQLPVGSPFTHHLRTVSRNPRDSQLTESAANLRRWQLRSTCYWLVASTNSDESLVGALNSNRSRDGPRTALGNDSSLSAWSGGLDFDNNRLFNGAYSARGWMMPLLPHSHQGDR